MKVFRNHELGIDIFLGEKIEIMDVLGIPVEFKTGEYSVTNSYFKYRENLFLTKKEAVAFVNNLLKCKTTFECYYFMLCSWRGVREGSIIEFDDGKQGVILGKEYSEGILKYTPFKKDGTVGKAKRCLYGNLKYKVVKY